MRLARKDEKLGREVELMAADVFIDIEWDRVEDSLMVLTL